LLVLASIEEHVRDVSRREFEALTLDHSPPTPDLTHRHGHYMLLLLFSFSFMAVGSSL
jgi:hypothetical protein